jgi:pimeloyl-ACP methyl ester carboxylesterase
MPLTSLVRRLTPFVAALALLLPAAATPASAGPAPRPAAKPAAGPAAVDRTTPAARPTIVLVHGAWADSSSWSGEIERLQRAGYVVRAVPNPLRGLTTDAATVAGFLATIAGPVVLVGHSYGGAVITNAAAGNPNVRALVYVDAFVPDVGEAVTALTGAGSVLAADPATVFDFAPYPGAPAGDADLYLKRSVFLDSFASDLPDRVASVLWATQRPAAASGLGTPSTAAAWRTIPSWYLLGTRDSVITPAEQLFMARRAHARIVRVAASHVSLISHPAEVTALILSAARSVH